MRRMLFKKTCGILANPLPLPWLIKMTGQKFIFPFYHLVAENTPRYIRNLYSGVTPERFRKDLEFLLKHYHPAGSREVADYVRNGKKCSKPLFFLTFDDGLRNCYDYVFPILKHYGIEAAFFVNSAFVDNRSMFYRFKVSLLLDVFLQAEKHNSHHLLVALNEYANYSGKNPAGYLSSLGPGNDQLLNLLGESAGLDFDGILRREKPYMSLEQLKEMASAGYTVGSHSVDHPVFSALALPEQIRQFEESIKYVNDNVNPEVRMFAFPFTDEDTDPDFFEYLKNSDRVDVTFGTAGIKNDDARKHLQRIPMEVWGINGAGNIIQTEYSWYLVKALFGKNLMRH